MKRWRWKKWVEVEEDVSGIEEADTSGKYIATTYCNFLSYFPGH